MGEGRGSVPEAHGRLACDVQTPAVTLNMNLSKQSRNSSVGFTPKRGTAFFHGIEATRKLTSRCNPPSTKTNTSAPPMSRSSTKRLLSRWRNTNRVFFRMPLRSIPSSESGRRGGCTRYLWIFCPEGKGLDEAHATASPGGEGEGRARHSAGSHLRWMCWPTITQELQRARRRSAVHPNGLNPPLGSFFQPHPIPLSPTRLVQCRALASRIPFPCCPILNTWVSIYSQADKSQLAPRLQTVGIAPRPSPNNWGVTGAVQCSPTMPNAVKIRPYGSRSHLLAQNLWLKPFGSDPLDPTLWIRPFGSNPLIRPFGSNPLGPTFGPDPLGPTMPV
eukprot:193111-Chlamydomonas_euryale.AAC.6